MLKRNGTRSRKKLKRVTVQFSVCKRPKRNMLIFLSSENLLLAILIHMISSPPTVPRGAFWSSRLILSSKGSPQTRLVLGLQSLSLLDTTLMFGSQPRSMVLVPNLNVPILFPGSEIISLPIRIIGFSQGTSTPTVRLMTEIGLVAVSRTQWSSTTPLDTLVQWSSH